MTYEILQLKQEHLRNYGFMDYDWAKEHGFNLEHYNKVYEGEIDNKLTPEQACEELFVKFNINRPEDFKGHSLSVSDIVVLDGHRFYTEGIGFKRLN